jgi:hypothetical protein
LSDSFVFSWIGFISFQKRYLFVMNKKGTGVLGCEVKDNENKLFSF